MFKNLLKADTLLNNLEGQVKLIDTLKFFRKENLINHKPYLIYLFSYISPSLSIKDKLEIITYHYRIVKNIFEVNACKKLFGDGIEIMREEANENVFSISLFHDAHLEFEGSLTLSFNVNEVSVYALSFTLCPGRIFKSEDETIIYISKIQGGRNQHENILKVRKQFCDIHPTMLLFKALETIGLLQKVRQFLGIPTMKQLSYSKDACFENFDANYDQFWSRLGGVLVDGNYKILCPREEKSLNLIKQKHRNRTLKKRMRLKELSVVLKENLMKNIYV